MDFPQSPVAPLFILSFGMNAAGGEEAMSISLGAPASTSWGTANKALYIPFWLPWPYLVARVFWGNGSTVTGNKDFGIYTMDGTLIYSTGSTACTGFASVLQYTSPATPFILPPGRYYMAISCSGTTNAGWGTAGTANAHRLCGILEQTSALPLPATATFALTTATLLPVCGITRTASGF